MQQRGRKSAAQLSVIAGTIGGRPKPPSELTKDQQDIWERVIASEPADLFKTVAVQQMLGDYCRHRVRADWLDDEIAAGMKASSPLELVDVDRLMKMAERETRACMSLATKMRVTNQSRYRADKAHQPPASGGRKLWERRA